MSTFRGRIALYRNLKYGWLTSTTVDRGEEPSPNFGTGGEYMLVGVSDEMEVELTETIDKQVEYLENQKAEAEKEHRAYIRDLDSRINNLQALEHQPEDDIPF